HLRFDLTPARGLRLRGGDASSADRRETVCRRHFRRTGRMCWNKERYANDAEYRGGILARKRAWNVANRDKVRARARDNYIKRLYGISRADYDALIARQGGLCAICRKPSKLRLCVDHCHLTGMIRGLLCRKCNAGLGCLGEDQRALVAALAYLGARSDD